MQPSGRQLELAFGEQTACAVEVGAGLRTYAVAGRAVLLGYGPSELCTAGRGQVLAPWPNRIAGGRYSFDGRELQLPVNELATGSAIHGLVRWSAWTVAEQGPAAVRLEHVLHPQPGYPFALALAVTYRLSERGLEVQTTAENVGDLPCPFGLGHHPYVAGSVDDLFVQLPGREQERIGDRRIDEAFTGFARDDDGLARVQVGDVVVWLDEGFPYVQLFTGDLPEIGRRGLAVEPMTCPPNAFRTGEALLRLEPGGRFEGRWGITLGG